MQGASEVMFAILARSCHFLLLPSASSSPPPAWDLGGYPPHLHRTRDGPPAASQGLIDSGHFPLFMGIADVQSGAARRQTIPSLGSHRRIVEACNVRRQPV